MANLNAKLARQQQAAQATRTTIAHLEQLVKSSKDEQYRINANLVLAQLRTKLARQVSAATLTEWQLQLDLDTKTATRK